MKCKNLISLFKVMDTENYTQDELNDKAYIEDRIDAILEMMEIEVTSDEVSDLAELYLIRLKKTVIK